MGSGGPTRKLTTILAADVAGFTRLTGADEEATVTALRAHRLELIDALIAAYDGRIANTAGDSLLVEFPSVVGALRCAHEIQAGMAERNSGLPKNRRIEFRIGINVGDVIEQDGDLLGDGVNLVARLEELAEPGGICLSRAVRDQVHGRSDIDLEDLGEVELKNVTRPVRVFRVRTGKRFLLPRGAARRLRRTVLVVVAAIAIGVLAVGTVWMRPWQEPAGRSLSSLAARTSIAVLPFENLSGEADRDYLSDGITNDLITDLSKFDDLFVIASNSVSVYKNDPVDVQQVGRDLGVSYVLEGSVQRQGERIRINAQLIDADTGNHLWAERYDDESSDIFALQDKIARRIIRSLAVRLSDVEEERAFAKPTRNLQAYDYYLRGRALIEKSLRRENFEARDMFRRAIELDADFSSAYAGLGWTYIMPVLYGWTGQPQRALEQAHGFARTALSKSDTDVDGRRLLARVYVTRRQHDLALIETERMIASNPNDPRGHIEQGQVLFWMGRPEGSALALETARRFDPRMGPEAYWHLAAAYYLMADYPKAVAILERNIERRQDNVMDHIVLAAAYAQSGQVSGAQRAAAAVRRLDPFFSSADFGQLLSDRADAERFIDGLQKAGL